MVYRPGLLVRVPEHLNAYVVVRLPRGHNLVGAPVPDEHLAVGVARRQKAVKFLIPPYIYLIINIPVSFLFLFYINVESSLHYLPFFSFL